MAESIARRSRHRLALKLHIATQKGTELAVPFCFGWMP
jgi:hypothetical protein